MHIAIARPGHRSTPLVLAALLMLCACAEREGGAAPVVMNTPGGPGGGQADIANPGRITIQRGQTLYGVSRTYHIPVKQLIAANRLEPPYALKIGQTLTLPGDTGGGPVAMASAAPALGTAPSEPGAASRGQPSAIVAIPLDPPRPPLPPRYPPERAVADRGMTPAPTASLAEPNGATPPAAAERDSPGPVLAPVGQPPIAAAPDSDPSARGTSGSSSSPRHAETAAPRGGQMIWPVRGRVLATFGDTPGGTHNDGINIAAPKGAAIQAVDGGVVAYAGNELRGYGNLILIKHPNGLISTYAHCDIMLVKRDQKVTRGQVIARVGSTGGVSEPQLHFEVRRSNRPVDPREMLTPLPTASYEAPGPRS